MQEAAGIIPRCALPPKTHARPRFYVVSPGKAGLSDLAAANRCSCSFYSPRKSNTVKRETKCVSIWRGEEGGSALGAAKRKYPGATLPCRRWASRRPQLLAWRQPGGPGELGHPSRSPGVLLKFQTGWQSRVPPPPPTQTRGHLQSGGWGWDFSRLFSCAAVAVPRLGSMGMQAVLSE